MKQSRQQLMKSFQKGKTYAFVVTNEHNAVGCQIVQDPQGVKHLLTGTRKTYPVGKSVRLEVRGYSHSPSDITGSYYLILSPNEQKVASGKPKPSSGGFLILPKKKKTGFAPSFLKSKYKVGKRYQYVITDVEDSKGHQFVEDSYGIKHKLTGTKTRYLPGENVRCTVILISREQSAITKDYFLVLSHPRVVGQRENVVRKYVKSPAQWYSEVQGLDKHQSGRPFTCGCCGQDFPGRMGYRVDLKDVYFCKSCARKIFEPKERKTEPVLIYTPMGNKR